MSTLTGLYPILDVGVVGIERVDGILRALTSAGPALIQLRAKGTSPRLTLELARRCVPLAGAARLVVNDHLDLAIASGAAGVHLGQDDLPVRAARRIAPRPFLIGCSTHDLDQLDQALAEDLDYVAYGPVFTTRTKADAEPAVGLVGLVEAARRAARRGVPLVAIGGIGHDQLPAIRDAGAAMAAMIGALLADPEEEAVAAAIARAHARWTQPLPPAQAGP